MINTENINITYRAIVPVPVNSEQKSENTVANDQKEEGKKVIQQLLSGIKQPVFYYFDEQHNSPLLTYLHSLAREHDASHIHLPELMEAYVGRFTDQQDKGTTFFTVHKMSDLIVDDEVCDAIVLAVLEEKENVISVATKAINKFELFVHNAYLGNAITKLALILYDVEGNMRVMLPESKMKGYEGRIWKDDFLCLKLIQNEYSNTSDYIQMTAKFIKNRLSVDELTGKTEEVEMLQATNNYFRENDHFEEKKFKEMVLADDHLIDAFDDYKVKWQEKNNKQLMQEFEVSDEAWANQQKVFKSVIKLDKNFHVYVHGDHQKIKKGVDENGRKYYILYYENES